ncbi:MAG: hypothetical protein HY897_23715 [Deltaproteobacteria bacterium]|nr:hypothetical protein [Deltaproteobacteria bacterium]
MGGWGNGRRAAGILIAVAAIGCGSDPEQAQTLAVREPEPCIQGTGSSVLRSEGFLLGATFWDCAPPRATESRPAFAQYEGTTNVVTGGSTKLDLAWEGLEQIQGRSLVVSVKGERGYFIVPAPGNDQPLTAEIFVSPEIESGTRNLLFAVDDGTGTPDEPVPGKYLSVPLKIIHVGTGDIQISLNWDRPNDVDLHVIEPSGEEIFYAHRTSSAGGQLDLDSNPDCSLDHWNNENIFWPAGGAPSGVYVVNVVMYANCGVEEPTRFRVTVTRAGGVDSFEGAFCPNQDGMVIEVTRFTRQ